MPSTLVDVVRAVRSLRCSEPRRATLDAGRRTALGPPASVALGVLSGVATLLLAAAMRLFDRSVGPVDTQKSDTPRAVVSRS